MRNFKPDKEFQYTEKRLYEFYEKLDKLESVKAKIELLQRQMREIEEDMKETNVYIDPEANKGIDYSGPRVQSSNKSSPQESQFMLAIGKLEIESLKKYEDIRDLKEIKRQLEVDIDGFNRNIYSSPQKLSDEARALVEYKYRDHHSLQWIADKTNRSKSGIEYIRKTIVESIIQWGWIKG